MSEITELDHSVLAETLRRRVLDGPGETPATLRQAVAARAAGGAEPVTAPHDFVVKKIGDASWRVTDGEVAAVAATLGSQKAAFEIVATAALGAALRRWDRGMQVLAEAENAAE